jgi:hypothetical protein
MEQRAIVQFLILKKLSAMDITAELEGLYGHEAPSLSAVKKWRKQFCNGRITLEDESQSEDRLEAISVNLYRPWLMKHPLFHATACVRSCESR